MSHRHCLILLIAGALFLYFYGSDQAFRSDEVWSLDAVAKPLPAMVSEIAHDVHPPLYFLLLRFWTMLFGTGEIAVRTLSIVLSLAAAFVVYVTGREWFGERGGLLAATLFITSPISTVAAQLARMYGLLALVSALSLFAFFRLSRSPDPRPRDWALYVLANIAGSFTHAWFFFLLFAQGCTWLVYWRTRKLGHMAAAAAVSLVPYGILWAPNVIHQFVTTGEALAWVPVSPFVPAGQSLLLLGGLIFLCAPLCYSWWRRRAPGPLPAGEPALIAAVTLLIPFLLSFSKPIFWPRYTVAALPPLCLAITALAPRKSRNEAIASPLPFETGLLAAWCFVALMAGWSASKCDSRRTAEYLASTTKPGDIVVFTSLSRLPIDYYWDRIQPDRRVLERSFPAEIDTHPGFEGSIHTGAAHTRLQGEARRLTTELTHLPSARVFFLHGFRPQTDALLKNLLDSRLAPVQSLDLSCTSMGSYFQYLSAYSCDAAFTPATAQSAPPAGR